MGGAATKSLPNISGPLASRPLLGAYASVALVCAGSLVVGQAILFLCGRRDWTWLSGPVGLAALLVASGLAIKLPGHGTAAAHVAFRFRYNSGITWWCSASWFR